MFSLCVCCPVLPIFAWKHSTHLPRKHKFAVGRRTPKSTYTQIVVRSNVCVLYIDGHEFRSSISSNHKFTFNAFLSSTAVAAASSKNHQFFLFYVSRDFVAHTKAEPMQTKHITLFSVIIIRNQNKPTNNNVFFFSFFFFAFNAHKNYTILIAYFACAYSGCAIVLPENVVVTLCGHATVIK